MRALPHAADPQQSWLGAREWVDRKLAWSSEASNRGRAVAARVARFRYARGLSPLRRRGRLAAEFAPSTPLLGARLMPAPARLASSSQDRRWRQSSAASI